MDESEHPPEGPPTEQTVLTISLLQQLLQREPSGPGTPMETAYYCENTINEARLELDKALKTTFPTAQAQLTEIFERDNDIVGGIPPASFAESDSGSLQVLDAEGRIVIPETNSLIATIHAIDPSLGVFEYIAPLQYLGGRSFKTGKERIQYPGFGERFDLITQELATDDPRAQIVALAFLTQVAKNSAVNTTKKVAERVLRIKQGRVTLDDSAVPTQLLTWVGEQIQSVRNDEAFLAKGAKAIDEMAEQSDLDKTQVQLLFDLAFFRKEAFDSPEQFTTVFFAPIIEAIKSNNWAEAYKLRDFLRKNVSATFPYFRTDDSLGHSDSASTSTRTLTQLSSHIREGRTTSDELAIPAQLEPAVQTIIDRKIGQLEKEGKKNILRDTVAVSERVVALLNSGGFEHLEWMHPKITRINDVYYKNGKQLYGYMDEQGKFLRGYDFGKLITNLFYQLSPIPGSEEYDDRDKITRERKSSLFGLLHQAYGEAQGASPAVRKFARNYSIRDYLESLFRSGYGGVSDDLYVMLDEIERYESSHVVETRG